MREREREQHGRFPEPSLMGSRAPGQPDDWWPNQLHQCRELGLLQDRMAEDQPLGRMRRPLPRISHLH